MPAETSRVRRDALDAGTVLELIWTVAAPALDGLLAATTTAGERADAILRSLLARDRHS